MAVVTAVGRGIGRAIAHTLAGEDAVVVLVVRTLPTRAMMSEIELRRTKPK